MSPVSSAPEISLSRAATTQREMWLKVGAFAIGAAFLWLYAPILNWLWLAWRGDEYYAHGPFLPPLCAWLLWQKRARLAALWRERPRQSVWPSGLIPFALGLQIVGTLVDMNIVRALQAFSIGILLLGIARTLGGRALEREIRFPILFLWLAVPLSGPMVETLTVPLQNYAASASAMFLGLLGMPIERSGVNLYTPLYHFVVAVPCSGLKTAITLLTMGVLIAHLLPGLSEFQRWMLALISVPVALGANTLRVMLIVWIGNQFGTAVAEGFLHSWSGLFLFAVALAALLGIGALWTRQNSESPVHLNLPINAPISPVPSRLIFKKQLVVLALLLLARGIGTWAIPDEISDPSQTKSALSLALPAQIGAWRGRDVAVDPVIYEVLQPDAVLQKRFRLPAAKSQVAGAEVEVLVVYSRDPRGLHSPVTCMGAQGWTIAAQTQQMAKFGSQSLNLDVLHAEQRGQRAQLAYCFTDASEAVSGRVATFAKMMIARLMRRRVGAVEMQFAYDGRSLGPNGEFSPALQALMLQTAREVRRQLAKT